jgi:hypothetical protein
VRSLAAAAIRALELGDDQPVTGEVHHGD